MREMEYKNTPCSDVLDTGSYRGYDYMIISYGTHPCAYVAIPDNHHLYEQDLYEMPDFGAHFGLTFADRLDVFGNRFCIGWDYIHFGDYAGFFESIELFANERKWTTAEILEEVKSVINNISSWTF